MERYHLHKDDYSKLHFEVNDMGPYLGKNSEHAFVPHKHSFYQVLWFYKPGVHYVDYENKSHEGNTFIFINTNQVHSFDSSSDNEGVMIHFNAYFVRKYGLELLNRFALTLFGEIGEGAISVGEPELGILKFGVDQIKKEISDITDSAEEMLFNWFKIMLLTLERIKVEREGLDISGDSNHTIAVKFKMAIYANLDQSISIDQYAFNLGVNRKKLEQICKEKLDATPAMVIRSVKLLEAKRKLANIKISIQSIAFDLGFDQPTYFTKFFRKYTGLTPKEFRESVR